MCESLELIQCGIQAGKACAMVKNRARLLIMWKYVNCLATGCYYPCAKYNKAVKLCLDIHCILQGVMKRIEGH